MRADTYSLRECQLVVEAAGVRSQGKASWLVERLFGKQHWCARYVDSLCQLDANFLRHLSEQTPAFVHYLCLVRLAWKSHSTRAPSLEDQARLLQARPQKTLLRSLYTPYPDGLLNVLPKLGTKPLSETDYRRLMQLMADPDKRQYLAHTPRIKPYHLQWLENYPCDILHWRILHSVKKSEHYASLKYLVAAVRSLQNQPGYQDVLVSLKRIRSLTQLENWFRRHVQTLPFPPPPWSGNDWIEPITSAKSLKAASLLFKNCIYEFTRAVLLGRYYFYQVGQVAVVSLIKDPVIGWHIGEINGVNNETPEKAVVAAIEQAFAEADFVTDVTEEVDALWDADFSYW